ncbi:unnamed protein product, partial [Iphiclides podalirius]
MARKHFGMRNVWTLDGRIYIKLPDGSRKKISPEEDFSALVTAWTPVCSPASAAASGSQQGVCGATNDVPSIRSSPKASRQQEVERRKKEASALTYGDNKKTRRVISKK